MSLSMSQINMGKHAETHHKAFPPLPCDTRKVIHLKGINFFSYSCGLLHVVFWKGCLSIIVLMITKMYLKRDKEYILCWVDLKIRIKTLWRIVKSKIYCSPKFIALHLMLEIENLYRSLSLLFWTGIFLWKLKISESSELKIVQLFQPFSSLYLMKGLHSDMNLAIVLLTLMLFCMSGCIYMIVSWFFGFSFF